MNRPTTEPPTCPICGGRAFDRVDRSSVGGWREADGDLMRYETALNFGVCRCCGHAMVLNRYSSEDFSILYDDRSPVFWGADGEGQSAAYADMIRFCLPDLVDGTGPVVDFGCGHGDLLREASKRVSADRLLGIDFRQVADLPFPFRACDLNAADLAHDPSIPDSVGFAFATHLLEHVVDPRRFLRGLRERLSSRGRLYIEVPDCTQRDIRQAIHAVGLVCGQHIHYFTEASLTALLGSVGFQVVRSRRVEGGMIPRLMLLAEPAVANESVGFVHHVLDRQRWARSEAARLILGLDGELALWGLGYDFAEMVSSHPAFHDLCAAGTYALFDRDLAGRRWQGQPVQDPSELSDFPGTIVLLPMPGNIRLAMKRWASVRFGKSNGLVDPYERLVPIG